MKTPPRVQWSELEQVGRALDVAAETGEQWYVSRLHRIRAELRLHTHGPDDEGVEVSLRQVIAMARQQGAKGWELGPSTSLARLWRDQGKRAEARDLLAPIYGWFTEGYSLARESAARRFARHPRRLIVPRVPSLEACRRRPTSTWQRS